MSKNRCNAIRSLNLNKKISICSNESYNSIYFKNVSIDFKQETMSTYLFFDTYSIVFCNFVLDDVDFKLPNLIDDFLFTTNSKAFF